MKILKNKSGFTLIEIIVVLIIVGVLAAIALPNLYTNIMKSKGGEAVASFGSMKANLEACGQKNGANYTTCKLGTTQLGTEGNFYYEMGKSDCSTHLADGTGVGDALGYCIWASYPTGAHNAVNYITLARTNATTITCTGNGSFSGLC